MTVRVQLVAESDATGHLADLYEEVKSSLGVDFVPDMFRLLSTQPHLLDAVLRGYRATFLQGQLERQVKEVVAAWTARVNECPYCVGTHTFFALVHGGSEVLATAIETAESVEDLPVDDRTRALLALVEKVTRTPWRITDGDWTRTREAGWSDTELLEAVFTGALFNTITRLVDALGLGSSVDSSRIARLADS
jgi:uncharacterized peroxidase-related enzyme